MSEASDRRDHIAARASEHHADDSPGGGGGSTVLRLGEGGFEALNGWSGEDYGPNGLVLYKSGRFCALSGVITSPDDFVATGNSLDILQLPAEFADPNQGFASSWAKDSQFAQPDPDFPGNGSFFVTGDAKVNIQQIAAGAGNDGRQNYILRHWWIAA